MKEQVKQLIIERQKASGNSSGTSVTYLMDKFNATYDEVKVVLNELFKERVIVIRKGVNSQLIFLSKKLLLIAPLTIIFVNNN
jgi:hypothetical protein